MSRLRTHARNLIANWVGHATNLAVMFFLSPFVVHRLGDAAYGVWSLMVMVTGYVGLVDLGVRVSTGRYVNFYIGRGDYDGVNRMVNTSLAFYSAVSLLMLVVSGAIGLSFGRLFPKAAPSLGASALPILLLLASAIWLGFLTSVFEQLLHARERFDLRNGVDLTILAVRSGMIVGVLLTGHGLMALAFVQMLSQMLGCVLAVLAAQRYGPSVHYGASYLSWSAFRDLLTFGSWAFVTSASLRTVYYAAVAITGMVLGPVAVTYYSFGFMLIDYGRSLVALLPQQILKPATERAAGAGAMAELRWYFLAGSRMLMFLAVPLLVGYLVLGRQFLLLWLKDRAFERSAVVLSLLTVSQFWAIPSEPARSVLQGIGQVRRSAGVMILEAVANILLTLVLVMGFGMGLVGVALGTAIPMIVLEGLVLPWVACSAISFPIRRYVTQIAARWLAGALLLLPLAWLVARFEWSGWAGFAAKVSIVAIAYAPIGWFVILGPEERAMVNLQQRLTAARGFAKSL